MNACMYTLIEDPILIIDETELCMNSFSQTERIIISSHKLLRQKLLLEEFVR